jgi:ketosteroid isomerase-like protein
MEQRDAIDVERIRHLMAAYCHRIDDGDLAGWAALFADGARLVIGRREYEGRPAIRAWAEGSLAASDDATRHMVTNLEIDVAGDIATAISDFMVLSTSMSVLVAGRYDDRLARSDDGTWAFVERRIGFFRSARP